MHLSLQRLVTWGLTTRAGFVLLALPVSLISSRPAWAYELTFEQALDIAATAYQKQFEASPYGKREISITRSDGEGNACTLMRKATNDKLQLESRHYFTIIYWNVKHDVSAKNQCIFVDRISGNVIGTMDF